MKKRGETTIAVLALILVIGSFLLIQLQLNGFAKAVKENKSGIEANAERSANAVKVAREITIAVNGVDTLNQLNTRYLINHRHIGIYGSVDPDSLGKTKRPDRDL